MWTLEPWITSFLRETTYMPIKNFAKPVKVTAAKSGKICLRFRDLACGNVANGIGREADI